MSFRLISFLAFCLGASALHAATLRHRYPLDGGANDALNVAPLEVRGDSVAFPSTGGRVGGFVRLGGSDDYLFAGLEGGSALSILGDYGTFRPFSVSFWVRQTAAQAASGTQAVFGLTTDSSSSGTWNTGFETLTRESSLGRGVVVRARQGGAGSNEGQIATGFDVSDGSWHHVVVIYKAGSRLVYVDGTFRGENTVPVAITTNPISRFAIGAFLRSADVLDDFPGDIDDFQIYEGALTGAEALQLFLYPGTTLEDNPAEEALPAVEMVDPLIGVQGAGSCVPGPCLPNASINPSPNTLTPAPGGFTAGSDVVGFAQLHPQGSGPSTMSYGNFLVSPQIGAGTTEGAHASPIANVTAHPYSYRARLTKWNADCAVVAAANSAIYEFDFPASADARLYVDVARKQNSATGMTGGSVAIDPATGTISGGGTFDGNWNPAAYNVYFYAKVDRTPAAAGTWIGSNAESTSFTASTSTRRRLGGWMQFDTTGSPKIRMKIAVSFVSVEQARAFLEQEIPGWDLEDLEQQAKTRWAEALSVLRAPGISAAEGRKLYTALFHSLVQPRNRRGQATGWPADAPLWDDHYTLWDTWQTLFPLLAIVHPETVAANVNAFAERFERNGRAETAFIQGKDFQVGQGGDEVDLVVGDAWAKQISGIDWERVWPLLQHHANRRTDDYRNLGFVSSDGSRGGYDSRMRSGSSTLAFAYEDWCIAQVAAGLGHATEAATLAARSGNWKNVWDPTLVGDGFSGFVRARARNGTFSSSSATSSNDFYQGTPWNYSFNVPHDRDAMIDRMGGRARFIQRLEFALGKNSNSYIDFTNEPCFQTIWLFSHAARPYLASLWADRLRQRFGTYSFPGDEDSGAMSSLYFFLTAGFFPIAGQDLYYLHGPRVPRLEFKTANGSTFTVTAANAGGDNLYVQSATLNGQPLTSPTIRHADILAGSTLAFTMGPHPTAWGTAADFAPPPRRELVLPVRGPWTAALGDPPIAGADTNSPTIGAGAEGADNVAVRAAFPEITLGQAGDAVVLTANVTFSGLAATQTAPASRFAWGLFDADGQTGSVGWTGYLASNDTAGNGSQAFVRKASGNTAPFYTADGAALATFALPSPNFSDGEYRLVLRLVRTGSGALDYSAALVRSSDEVIVSAFTGSDLTPATFTFNRVGLRAGDALDADSVSFSGCTVVATRTTYAGRQLLIPSQGAFYLPEGSLSVTGLVNDGVLELAGGNLSVDGVFTNNGTLRLKGSSHLHVGNTLVNHGTIDTISSTGAITGNVENDGAWLEMDDVRLHAVIEGANLTLSFIGYDGHDYQLQRDASERLAGPWENLGSPVAGDGGPLSFELIGAADRPAGFYRLRADP